MNERRRSRDIALTTLIDLLVQVVFVFTLLLLASGAIEGSPEQRGYLEVDEWKTLVSIFDVDPKKNTRDQAKEIQDRYQGVRQERDKAKEENQRLRDKIAELDKRIAILEGQRGAPGYPPCRMSDGSEILVIRAEIDARGDITASLLPGAKEQNLKTPESAIDHSLSRRNFSQAFAHWRTSGLSREPKCLYGALVQYNPEAKAGDYQPAIAAVLNLFRIQQITRVGRQ